MQILTRLNVLIRYIESLITSHIAGNSLLDLLESVKEVCKRLHHIAEILDRLI